VEIAWRAPKRVGFLKFCIQASDAARNRSKIKMMCAPLAIQQ